MANEISLNVALSARKGNFQTQFAPGAQQYDQTTAGQCENVVVVGTAEEDLSTGDIVTLGLWAFRNLDPTNYVDWGPKSGGAMIDCGRIEPNDVGIIRLKPGVTIRWIANGAPVRVQSKLLEK